MLPVLFTITIPAGWGLPVAGLVVVLVALSRALAAWWPGRGEGPGFWRAVGADGWFLALLLAAVGVAWKAGALRGTLRLPLHSYGLLLALAFFLGVVLAQREARRRGLDAEALADLTLWLLVAGILGSQVFYVLLNREEFSGASFWGETPFGEWPRFLILWRVGLVFYGGLIGALVTAFLYMRRRRMPFLPYADTLVTSVAFGHFLGRLGCFGAGCCWGSRAGDGLPWGVRFPVGSNVFAAFSGSGYDPTFLSPDRLHTVALHPVQLYEAFGELAIFLVLVLLVRPRKRFHGQVLASWLLLYAVLRGAIELFRGDLARQVHWGLNSAQWTSVAILAVGAQVWVLAPRARPAQATAPV